MNMNERLLPLFERLPEAQRAARAPLWQRLAEEGFPNQRHERWKYTDLAGSLPDALSPPPPSAPELPAIDGLRCAAFVNGRAHGLDDAERFEPGTPAVAHTSSDPSDLVNASLATTGLRLNSGDAHLCTRTDSGSVHLRHRVALPAGGRAFLFWDDAVSGDAGFVTQTLDIDVGAGAQLTLVRLHRNTSAGPALLRTQARLADDAELVLSGLDTGSGLSRHNLHVTLDGARARAVLDGIYAPYGKGQLDTFAVIEHARADTVSRMRFRGLGMDRGVGVLVGRVHVHPDAQRIDSDQQLSGLLLSPRAQINAKPELEIYADDVVCSHGATAGDLDHDALFYLRARGIPEPAARAMLIEAFLAESVHNIAAQGICPALMSSIGHWLAGRPKEFDGEAPR